ncbi:MAG: LysR family transcriptional regulator [Idiomarina sp.]
MTLWQLQMLAAVADSGSLQGAAAQLHRTQSAISMALKKLEDEAGFALFDPSGYRLQLTPRGEQFLRQAQEVIKQQARLESLTEKLQQGAEAQLRIAYDHTCDPVLLIDALRSLQQSFPATELLLLGESQMRTLRRLREGEVDVGLCPWLPVFRQYGDFETRFVEPFTLAVVISRELAAQTGGVPTTREALLDLPMLIPQNLDVGISLDAILRLPGQQRIRVNDSHTQRELLLAGLGWGVIPQQLVARSLDDGQLIQLSIPGFLNQAQLEVHLVRAANRIAGPAAAHLWERI